MTRTEALKLALDALGKFSIGYHVDAVELNDLIATLEAALEQSEQKSATDEQIENAILGIWQDVGDQRLPGIAHPPRREWKGLKEWEINDGLDQLPTEDVCSWSFRKGVYFAEKALKERNL